MKIIKSIFASFALIAVFAFGAFAQSSIASLDGSQIDLAAQRGKVVILSVGASWLPLSGKQAEYTNMLARRYSGKNVAVYFVSTDSMNSKSKNFATNDRISKFVAESKLSVPVLRDSDGGVVMKRYQIDQIPSFIIIDKNGNQAGEAFGGIDPKFDITVPISKAVDRLL
ncbi:MAG: TlpA family protein disulfide reductase [Acidobacteria bacterium]|nr:TlpA family protein disulfide reductase [Acidobacteriota bacterium]